MADQPVPAFLDAEQQALFLRAYSAASFLMGCSTSGVDSYPLDGGDPPELGDYETCLLYTSSVSSCSCWYFWASISKLRSLIFPAIKSS